MRAFHGAYPIFLKRRIRIAKTPLIIVQDGAIDELMSRVLAWSFEELETTGVAVLGADCVGPPTVEVSRKILSWLGTPEVPVTLSESRGVNAFPWSYRPYSMMANLVPLLNPTGKTGPPISTPSAELMIVEQVQAAQSAGEKAVLLVLCPMTPVADALVLRSAPIGTDAGRRSTSGGTGIGRMWLGGPGITASPDKESPQPTSVLTETRLWALDTVSGRALSAGSEECLKSVPQAGVAGRERTVAPVRECAVCGGGWPVATGGGFGVSIRRRMSHHAARLPAS